MKSIRRISTICFTLIILLISCEKPDVTEDSRLLNELYSNSFDTVFIQDSQYRLETELYRDFFPSGMLPRKTPLIVYLSLIRLDSLSISDNIDISKLYVINDQLIWISNPRNVAQPIIPVDYILNKVRNDGPKWPTDIYVDVVARIVDSKDKSEYLLIARYQRIKRVE